MSAACLQLNCKLFEDTNYIVYFLHALWHSVEFTAVTKCIFPEFLKTFSLILEFHARQVAAAVCEAPPECGVADGGGRSGGEGALAVEQ